MRLRYVEDTHYLLGDKASDYMSAAVRHGWNKLGIAHKCGYAIAAHCDGKVSGFFRYSIAGSYIDAGGTWVANRYRNKSLAKRMWAMALKKHSPDRVSVIVCSQEGAALVSSLKTLYSEIEWDIDSVDLDLRAAGEKMSLLLNY